MANVTIHQLPALAIQATDQLEIQRVDGGASGKITVEQILDLVPDGTVAWGQIQGTLANQSDLQAALNAKAPSSAVNTATWGQIGGTLSNQADLQTALNAKAPSSAVSTATWGQINGTLVDQTDLKAVLDAKAPTSAINTAAWGNISGTLANQTDLQNALSAYLPLTGGTISGTLSVAGNGTQEGANLTLTGLTPEIGTIQMCGASATGNVRLNTLNIESNEINGISIGAIGTNAPVKFYTGSARTERMRLRPGGELCINQTAASGKLSVTGTAGAPTVGITAHTDAQSGLWINRPTSATADPWGLIRVNAGNANDILLNLLNVGAVAEVFTVDASGNLVIAGNIQCGGAITAAGDIQAFVP